MSNYWISQDVCENHHPTYTTSSSPVAVVNGSWYEMNVTSLIRLNYQQTYANLGFCVRDDTENDTGVWGTFYSSDCSETAYVPVLSITYTTTTSYFKTGAYWGSSDRSDLRLAVVNWSDSGEGYSPPDTYFQDEIDASYQRWNGVTSHFNIDSIARVTSPSQAEPYDIHIYGNYFLPDNYLGVTSWYPLTGPMDWAEIVLNTSTSGPMRQAPHDEMRQEAIVHELGHAAGLDDVWEREEYGETLHVRSSCVMQAIFGYCYPYPTSHDRQTLVDIYG